MISAIHARIADILEPSSQHETAELTEQDVELAGTVLLRELRHRYGIDA